MLSERLSAGLDEGAVGGEEVPTSILVISLPPQFMLAHTGPRVYTYNCEVP